MKVMQALFLFALVFGMTVVLSSVSCAGDDDDDDDDSNGPDVPHDYDAQTNCLASGCHEGKHGGKYNDSTIPDKCLECHS